MPIVPDISNFKALENVLESGLDGSISLDSSQLVELVKVFYKLNEELYLLSQKASDNDVLVTMTISEDSDYIIDESVRRAQCVDLFLKYDNRLPLEIYGKFVEQLPKFKEMAVLTRNILLNKKEMLKTLQEAGVTSKKANNSGCVVLLFVVVVFGSLLIAI